MSINWSLIAEIAKPVISAVVGGVIVRIFEKRPRLVAFYGQIVGPIQLPGPPPFGVNTHSVIVRNGGRLAAHNVRVPHNVLPAFAVYPAVHFTRQPLHGGGEELLFPTLVPGEQLTISYLYFPPLTWNQINLPIRSDEGLARVLNVLPTPQLRPWQLRGIWLLLIVGVIATIYAIVEAAEWGLSHFSG